MLHFILHVKPHQNHYLPEYCQSLQDNADKKKNMSGMATDPSPNDSKPAGYSILVESKHLTGTFHISSHLPTTADLCNYLP